MIDEYEIELLANKHDKCSFNCGIEALNTYIKTLAKQHQQRNISRTFIICGKDNNKILGYYTLATGQLFYSEIPQHAKHPKYPVSIIRLARLAIDLCAQRQGLGKYLLRDALRRIYIISQTVGVFAVIVDAKDEKVAMFYQQFGFISLENEPLTLFLLMKTISQLFTN